MATPAETDRELVRRARRGDVSAFTKLVQVHQDSIHGLIFRLVRDSAIAEELAQDVFVKAYFGLSRFREEATFSTWLYRIAINLFRDYRQSRAGKMRKSERSLEDLAESGYDPVSSDPSPDRRLAEKEISMLFVKSLDHLGETVREAFLLRHQEGRSYDEIAEILSISRTNAKVRVHRAREWILARMRERGHAV